MGGKDFALLDLAHGFQQAAECCVFTLPARWAPAHENEPEGYVVIHLSQAPSTFVGVSIAVIIITVV